MSTNTLQVAYMTGQTIEASHINEITSALLNDFVGRDSTGAPTPNKQLGNNLFPWGTVYAKAISVDLLNQLTYKANVDAVASGDSAQIIYADSIITYLTNNSLNTIDNLLEGIEGRARILVNKTGKTLFLLPDNFTLPDNEPLEFTNETALSFFYDATSLKWRMIGGAGAGGSTSKILGSVAAPIILYADQSIPFTGSQGRLIMFVASESGHLDLSDVNPQIQAGNKVGQELRIICVSGIDIFQLDTGNGLALLGPYLSDNNSVLDLMWNGSEWLEIKR